MGELRVLSGEGGVPGHPGHDQYPGGEGEEQHREDEEPARVRRRDREVVATVGLRRHALLGRLKTHRSSGERRLGRGWVELQLGQRNRNHDVGAVRNNAVRFHRSERQENCLDFAGNELTELEPADLLHLA